MFIAIEHFSLFIPVRDYTFSEFLDVFYCVIWTDSWQQGPDHLKVRVVRVSLVFFVFFYRVLIAKQ